jgi:mono/diheme cytochrome c family protein
MGLLVMLGGLLSSGCGKSPVPEFRLNMQGRDPADFRITSSDNDIEKKDKRAKIEGRKAIVNALVGMFGTPDVPYVFAESGLDLRKIELAAGPSTSDHTGKQRGLFRQHCAHCHGITGDGAGPTAAFLIPYPRDYRQGKFKFKATERAEKPTDFDLERILRDGIPGTAMPSFTLLASDEIAALVEYVKYLSMRGESEMTMNFLVYDQEEPLELNHSFLVEQVLQPVATTWTSSQEKVIATATPPVADTPEKHKALLAAGAELFKGGRAQCTKCHGPTAMGDGSEEALFDDWNKDKKPNELAWWLLPKQKLNPRNLRTGVYRGGRSPADLYRRIYAGINGTPMPGAGPAPGNPGTLKPEEIWQIVFYVRSLPFEAMSIPKIGGDNVHKARM